MKILMKTLLILPLISFLVGCESLPGTRNQQGAVIGGAAGAATGAAVAGGHRGVGALIGGALGAVGGYVVASKTGNRSSDDPTVTQAARKAQENPATAQDARRAMSADVNNDGFVTLDEVVAMKQAGFSDQQMISRLQATDQIFQLTAEQQQFLRDRGVSQNVISQMSQMNRADGASTTYPAPVTAPGQVITTPR
ncbi:MAG: hypothetical protein JWM68_3056 [Verrucomicrobiales bacterium]|nr:hypothetical protein [Verrucomicrobiales bacterium]